MRHIIIKESYESLRIVDDFILDKIREQGDLESRKDSEKDRNHLERLNLGDEKSNDFYNHIEKDYDKEDYGKEILKNKSDFIKKNSGETFYESRDDFNEGEEDFYGNYSCEKIISRREAHELYNYAMSKKLDMDNILWERDTLRFINYVGYMRLSTVSIEILPKISINHSAELERKALLNMLSKCGVLKVNYSEISSLKLYKQSLNEILAYLFSEKLQKELGKGVYGEYVYIEENINSLKGSLRVQEQIKNMASHSSKAFCRFEEFSRDNKLNKILSFFVKEVMKSVKNRETLRLLRISEMILGDVDERNVTLNEVNNFSFNRLNKPFEDAFTLGKMIVLG